MLTGLGLHFEKTQAITYGKTSVSIQTFSAQFQVQSKILLIVFSIRRKILFNTLK